MLIISHQFDYDFNEQAYEFPKPLKAPAKPNTNVKNDDEVFNDKDFDFSGGGSSGFDSFNNRYSNNSPVRKPTNATVTSKNTLDDRSKEIYKHNENILSNLDVFGESDSTQTKETKQTPLIDLFGGDVNTNAKPNNNNTTGFSNNVDFNTNNNTLNNNFNNNGFGGGNPSNFNMVPGGMNLNHPNNNFNNNVFPMGNNMNTGGSYNNQVGGAVNNPNYNNMNNYNNNNNFQNNSNMTANRNTINYSNSNTYSASNESNKASDVTQETKVETDFIKEKEPTNDLKVRFILKLETNP
jgi:hypothetical protein